MTKCESFLPVINKHSRILILGSMPGVKSLEEAQYYAHPKNRFWRVLGELCDCPDMYGFKYNDRLKIALDKGFAIWDVIKYCDRKGSLDSNIQNERPNDISGLLLKYKDIKTIILNGNKAYTAFKRHFPALVEKYTIHKMPSTSPANARFKTEDLIKEWQKALV